MKKIVVEQKCLSSFSQASALFFCRAFPIIIPCCRAVPVNKLGKYSFVSFVDFFFFLWPDLSVRLIIFQCKQDPLG